jgi:hypothetical protein
MTVFLRVKDFTLSSLCLHFFTHVAHTTPIECTIHHHARAIESCTTQNPPFNKPHKFSRTWKTRIQKQHCYPTNRPRLLSSNRQ